MSGGISSGIPVNTLLMPLLASLPLRSLTYWPGRTTTLAASPEQKAADLACAGYGREEVLQARLSKGGGVNVRSCVDCRGAIEPHRMLVVSAGDE